MPPARREKTISLKLPADLVDRLDAAANARVLGRGLLIELLLVDGLAHLIPLDNLGLTREAPDQ